MTIIVVMGGTFRHQEEVISGLMRARPGQVEKLCLAGLVDPKQRIERYQFLFSRTAVNERATLVVGVETPEEVVALRGLGAHFCHVRGPLAPVFKTLPILINDHHVASDWWTKDKPDMVLTPQELLSECLIANRKTRVRR